MATTFNTNFNGALPFSDTGSKMTLGAATALSFVVPGTPAVTYRARFGYAGNDSVWVALNKTATVPAPGTIVTSSNEEFKPSAKYVRGGDTLSFISTLAGAQVGISLLQLPS